VRQVLIALIAGYQKLELTLNLVFLTITLVRNTKIVTF